MHTSSQYCRIKGTSPKPPINVHVPSLDRIMEIVIDVIAQKSINKYLMPVLVSEADILSKTRRHEVVMVRFLYMYVAHRFGYTLVEIGHRVCNDHTLAIYGIKQCELHTETGYPFFKYYSDLILPVFGIKIKSNEKN